MHVSSPDCTSWGFTEAGIERAHCHHSPVSSGNCPGGKPCADPTFIGSVSPIAIAAIAKKSLVFFKASSSLSMGKVAASLGGPALYVTAGSHPRPKQRGTSANTAVFVLNMLHLPPATRSEKKAKLKQKLMKL